MITTFFASVLFLFGLSCVPATAQDEYPPGTFQQTPEDDLGLEPVSLVVPRHFKGLLPENPVLHVPPGFSVKVFAAGLAVPRMMAISPDGVLHVPNMRRYNYGETNSQIVALPDRNLDGIADTVRVVADGLRMVNSIAFYQGDLYAAATDQILRLQDGDGDGFYEQHEVFIDDLQSGDGHQHLSRTILFDEGNDKLYVSVGSSCNVCREDSPEEAAVLQFNADGTGRRVFARGLRNAVGMTLHPETNALWATNNGHDQDSFQDGRTLPPEWVGIVRDGGFYGWPLAYGYQAYIDFSIGRFERDIFPITPEDSLDVASMTRQEVMLASHFAPMGIHFYTGQLLPPRFRGAGFVAIHAGNRGTEPGYKVSALFADPDGANARLADFMTGFRPDPSTRDVWGTPMDFVTDAQGNLFISIDNVFAGGQGFILKVVPRRIRSDWDVKAPEVVYSGDSFALDATLRLDDLDPQGEAPVVRVDLSDFGGPADRLLDPTGDGSYRLQTTLDAMTAGEKILSVLVEQQTAYDRLTTVVRHPILVLPGADLLVVDEQLSERWQVSGSGGVELLPFEQATPSFLGETAAALQITNPSALGWRLTLTPEEPIVGPYLGVRFAFRPGPGATELKLLTVSLRPGKSVSLDESRVDLSRDEWQIVEIPMQDFAPDGPTEALVVSGFGPGSFYLDDLRFLTAPLSEPTAVEETRSEARPERFQLQQNIPNPFNSETTIGFTLVEDGPVALTVYNLSGQRVATLVDGVRTAGAYAARWDGRDDQGRALASGVYLYRLRAGRHIETRKLLLLQ